MTDEKKKKKSKSGNDPQQKTSEDLLASLFNDLESTGKVSPFYSISKYRHFQPNLIIKAYYEYNDDFRPKTLYC